VTVMSRQEKQQENVETIIVPQLASDSNTLASGGVDVNRLTRLNALEILCIAYFQQTPKLAGGNWVNNFMQLYKNLKMSENGWRAIQLVQAIGASKGALSQNVVAPPNVLSRNLWNRDWEQKAVAEGKVPQK